MTVGTGWSSGGEHVLHGGDVLQTWTHPTGATHVHRYGGSGWAVGVAVRTEADDDTGIPHVLEHLVGTGSRRYPSSSPLLSAMFRCGASFVNGLTETGRTTYAAATDDEADLVEVLDVTLDALHHPLLGEREFLRECCRHLSGGDRPAARFAGVVHHEMAAKRETRQQWVARLVADRLDAEDHRRYRHEGSTDSVVTLDVDACRAFHATWYRPHFMHSFSSGPDPAAVLGLLDTAHRAAPPPNSVHLSSPTRSAPGELIAPAHLPPSAQRIVHIGWPGDGANVWAKALAVRTLLSGSGVVTGPRTSPTGVDLHVLCPADRASAARSAAEKALAQATRMTHQDLLRHLMTPYSTTPAGVAWGLAVGMLRVRGTDLTTWLTTSTVDQAGHGVITDLEIGDHLPRTPPRWSAARAERDTLVWDRTPAPHDSTGPARPLATRSLSLPALRTPEPHLVHITGHHEPQVQFVSALTIDPGHAGVLGPALEHALAVGRFGVPGWAPLPRFDADGRTVVDIVHAPDPAFREHLLTIAADLTPTAAAKAVRDHVRRRSAQLLTAPAVYARLAARRSLQVLGSAREACDGLTALVECRSLAAETARSQIATVLIALAGAPVAVLVTGRAIPGDAFALAADLRSTKPPCPDPGNATGLFPTQHVRPTGFSSTTATTATVWLVPSYGAEPQTRAATAVLAHHLHRTVLHPVLRERLGVYAVGSDVDRLTGSIGAWSESNPCPADTLGLLDTVMADVAHQALSTDDLEVARLMAHQAERRDRACPERVLCSPPGNPSEHLATVDRSAVAQVAEMLAALPPTTVTFTS